MSENDKVTTKHALTAVAVFPVAVAINVIGLVLMWRWFVVPLGVPAIGAAHAAGLAGIKGFLFRDNAASVVLRTGTAMKLALDKSVEAMAASVGMIALGYVCHRFM